MPRSKPLAPEPNLATLPRRPVLAMPFCRSWRDLAAASPGAGIYPQVTNVAWRGGLYGYEAEFPAPADTPTGGIGFGTTQRFGTFAAVSVAALVKLTGTANNRTIACHRSVSTNWQFRTIANTGTLQILGNLAANRNFTAATALTVDQYAAVGLSWTHNGVPRCFRYNAAGLAAENAAGGGLPIGTVANVELGVGAINNSGSPTQCLGGRMAACLIWNVALPDAAMAIVLQDLFWGTFSWARHSYERAWLFAGGAAGGGPFPHFSRRALRGGMVSMTGHTQG